MIFSRLLITSFLFTIFFVLESIGGERFLEDVSLSGRGNPMPLPRPFNIDELKTEEINEKLNERSFDNNIPGKPVSTPGFTPNASKQLGVAVTDDLSRQQQQMAIKMLSSENDKYIAQITGLSEEQIKYLRFLNK